MKLPTKRTAQTWRRTALTTAVLMSLGTMSTTVNADRAPIGDLEIYQSILPGKPKLMIMIDVSSSMRGTSIQKDYGTACNQSGKKDESTANINTKERNDISFDFRVGSGDPLRFHPVGCQVGQVRDDELNGNPKEIDRLARLQITLMKLLSDSVSYRTNNGKSESNATTLQSSELLPDTYGIGVGIFGYDASNPRKAKIIQPVGELTDTNRQTLITAIAGIREKSTIDNNDTSSSGSSIASAIVEAGAYMMATNPTKKPGTSESVTNLLTGKYSGFKESISTSKAGDYYKDFEADQCSGKGIFILTDDGNKLSGLPSTLDITGIAALPNIQMMNLSLNKEPLDTTLFNQCNSDEFSGAWMCTGAYARALRNPSNPSGDIIKTATAGIGKAFNVFTTNTKEVANCNKINSNAENAENAKNLCKLGELKENADDAYGNGKFYPVPLPSGNNDSATVIANSIADFASGLAGISNATPAGTITVPNNPYQVAEQLPFAYLPMLQPNISATSSIWNGNLKKYQLNNGTLYGKSNSALYTNTDASGTLSTSTKDLWQTGTIVTDSSAIDVGGVYAKLTTPKSGLSSVRTVYVEDTSTPSTSTLRKVGVNSDGSLMGFDSLVDPIYDEQNKRRILSFLGFKQYTKDSVTYDLLDINSNLPSGDTRLVGNAVMVRPTDEIRVLGGVVHSKPAAISYSANLDDNGTITNTREDYALFGSMDGALHLVNAADDSGVEQYAIIPKKMIVDQSIALVKDSKKAAVGQPFFGVDAPWLVTTDYKYDLTDNDKKVTVDTSGDNGMFAYGGLRMGGEGLYGIDISEKDEPSMLFTITSSTTGFSRLGQTWSKPTPAKIRKSKNAEPIDVLVFGGGYDMQYESDEVTEGSDGVTEGSDAKGNAIYIVNAKTGALIWSTSSDATNAVTDASHTEEPNMVHSITGGITVLDRDNDGLMDHLYAADLGGQVFRADFENARPAGFGFDAVNSFSNKRVVRILEPDDDTLLPYRFYERPVVSFYRNESTSKIFALVNVVSGNRSAPLSKRRADNTYANRVYGIIDTDVTSTRIFNSDFSKSIENLTDTNLLNLKTEINVSATTTAEALATSKKAARNKLTNGTSKGWYYPLTRFDGYENVKYNKGIGESVVINNLLYTTVYNPDKMYTAPQSCVTSILGGSERQVYCLPYGICTDANSKNGTGGYVPAGQGIQELTLGAFNSSNTDVKVLIGTRTLTDRINANNRIEYGAGDSTSKYYSVSDKERKAFSAIGSPVGGDGSAVEYLFNERYTLQPKMWYEKQ